jgi:predicted ATPase
MDESEPIRVKAILQRSGSQSDASAAAFEVAESLVSHGEATQISIRRLSARDRLTPDPLWELSPDLRSDIEKGVYDYEVTSLRVRASSPSEEFDANSQLKKMTRDRQYVSMYHFLPHRLIEPYNAFEDRIVAALQLLARYLSVSSAERTTSNTLSGFKLQSREGSVIRERLEDALSRAEPKNVGAQSIHEVRPLRSKLKSAETLADWALDARNLLSATTKGTLARQLRLISGEVISGEQRFRDSDLGLRPVDLPTNLASATRRVADFFKRMRYLGPLRDDPRAVYGLPSIPEMKDVGLKGEYTAAMLEQYQNYKVDYPSPLSVVDGLPQVVKQTPLAVAVREWLKRMDLVESVTTVDRGKTGFELSVRSSGIHKPLDLTSVGVGISQVLPSLVMALLAPEGATLLFEQPELHLHPKVQSALGDFFIGMAAMGKQCIVETHSEYLVNRIRRRIAESDGTSLNELTQIYFVEREAGASRFRSINPNEYGAILDWPKGFFDEGPSEAQLIMQAAMKKRSSKREQKN